MKPTPTPEQQARFDALLAWLDVGGDERAAFNMAYFHCVDEDVTCSTTCCIGGFVLANEYNLFNTHSFYRDVSAHNPDTVDCAVLVGQLLGMPDYLANNLCYTWSCSTDTQAAAKRVRHYLDTGELPPAQ